MNIPDESHSFSNNFVHLYMEEIKSKLVAKSGIPTDRFHIGKLLLQSLQDDPNFVMQIDGSSGKSETNGEVLRRCIQCASALTQLGARRGDVVVLAAPNHLDLVVPFFASLFLGACISPIDRLLSVYEFRDAFEILKPKAVFCQKEKVQVVKEALDILQQDGNVISFDRTAETLNFPDLLEQSSDNIDIQNFQVADFDAEETTAFLIPTSGTTGLPKFAILTHKNVIVSTVYIWCHATKFPSPVDSILIVSPLQWVTVNLNFVLATLLKYTRIQSPLNLTTEDTIDIIKKFKPGLLILSPILMAALVKTAKKMDCDFSSFEVMFFGGSAVPQELLAEVKRLTPKTQMANMFGMTEIGSCGFSGMGAPPGSIGKRIGNLQYQLVHIDTGDIIMEPNKPGELWLKNYAGFKGYYNNPTASAEAMSPDGWFKTGDIMYRDENWNYFFVERLKLLLKYKNHQISPLEIESVIRQHSGVVDVAVTGVEDPEFGDLPVACVVLKPGVKVSAEEIKVLVKEKLTDTKQLRGGVIFVEKLPLTSSGKLHRHQLKDFVRNYYKQQQ